MDVELRFLNQDEDAYLEEVRWRNNSLSISSLRGAALGSAARFKWSPAVRSLAHFFIRAAQLRVEGFDSNTPILSGVQGSTAATIDYALSKRPLWLCDMFGADTQGRPNLLSIVRRENSNLKRPGPVRLYLAPRAERELSISIYIHNQRLIHQSEFEHLLNSLAPTYTIRSKSQSARDSSSRQPKTPRWKKIRAHLDSISTTLPEHENVGLANQHPFLRAIFARELKMALSSVSQTTRCSDQEFLGKTLHHPLIRKLGIPQSKVLKLPEHISSLDVQLGIHPKTTSDQYQNFPSLTVKCSYWDIAAIAIFRFLTLERSLPITLSFQNHHSRDIAERAAHTHSREVPEILVLGLGSALSLLKQSDEYQVLMKAPTCSISLLTNAGEEQKTSSNLSLHVNTEGITTSGLFAQMKQNSGDSPIERYRLEKAKGPYYTHFLHHMYDDAFSSLAHFPHNRFLAQFSPARETYEAELDCLILVHRDLHNIIESSRIIASAINDAWLSIYSCPTLSHYLVSTFIEDRDFLKRTERLSGLFYATNLARDQTTN